MARKRKKRARSSRLARWFTLFMLLLVVVTWMPVLLLAIVNPPVTAFMLQQAGGHHGSGGYDYQWTDWPGLGTAPALAVMAAEDQKFPDHNGFDMAAIQDAIIGRLDGNRLRGASTITQQVAKNLFLWPGRSFARKGIEAYFTVLIELSWSKRRILEVYLNIAEFGPGVFGVAAASRIYFGKTPARLSDAEAALLAAVLPNPKELRVDQPSAYVRERQRWIMTQLDQLRRNDWISRVTRDH